MSEETTLLDAVSVLIERGIYKDRDALLQDALRALLRSKPELRGQLAVALYQRGDVSLTRAAEISGLDIESCKELLREASVIRRIPSAGQEVQGIRLVATFLVLASDGQRPLGEGVRLLQTPRQDMCLPQGKTTEPLKCGSSRCHSLCQCLHQQRHGIGVALA